MKSQWKVAYFQNTDSSKNSSSVWVCEKKKSRMGLPDISKCAKCFYDFGAYDCNGTYINFQKYQDNAVVVVNGTLNDSHADHALEILEKLKKVFREGESIQSSSRLLMKSFPVISHKVIECF